MAFVGVLTTAGSGLAETKIHPAAPGNSCFGCHAEMKSRIETAKSPHTLVRAGEDSCEFCHDSKLQDREHLLKEPVNGLCLTCHDGVIEGKQFHHKPADTSCVLCHDAHASAYPKMLHAQGTSLCLECHGPAASKTFQGSTDGPVAIALFGGAVRLSQSPFQAVPQLRLSADGNRGHPLPNHPVFDCVMCHRPHGANGSPKLIATEKADVSTLCVQCH